MGAAHVMSVARARTARRVAMMSDAQDARAGCRCYWNAWTSLCGRVASGFLSAGNGAVAGGWFSRAMPWIPALRMASDCKTLEASAAPSPEIDKTA